jgi:hypothetical protein
MTDIEAETRMVAEALGAELVWPAPSFVQLCDKRGHDGAEFFVRSEVWAALVALVRERDQLRAELEAMHELNETGVKPPLLKPAETGSSGCMVAEPRDHCTVGEGAASVPVRDWMDAQDDFGRRRRDAASE